MILSLTSHPLPPNPHRFVLSQLGCASLGWGWGSVSYSPRCLTAYKGSWPPNTCLRSKRRKEWCHPPTLGVSSCIFYTFITYLTTLFPHGWVLGNILIPQESIKLCSLCCWLDTSCSLPGNTYFRVVWALAPNVSSVWQRPTMCQGLHVCNLI